MGMDRKFIGAESEVRFVDVEAGRLKLFATAVGETDPIYSDEAAAAAKGYRAIPAPPTFAFSLGLLAPSKDLNVADIVENAAAGLHGEQKFKYHKMIFAGDRISLKSKITDMYDKKGGKLEFLVQETTAHNQEGVRGGEALTVIVIRN